MSVIIDGSAGVTTNAGGSVNPSTNVEGINYSCRAWVNFNGTGTVAINASGNVTNITDNSQGNYTINITTAISDANYSAVFGGRYSTGQANQGFGIVSQTTSAVRVITGTPSNNTAQDFDIVCAAIFR
jgi:hypothetical protein